MILGKISGKATTTKFEFIVEGDVQNFEYVQVFHSRYGYVLCQIIDLERDSAKMIAKCLIIGYKDDNFNVKNLMEPFKIGSEVLYADDDLVKKIVVLESKEKGGYIGKLSGRDIPVYIDLQKLLTKHLAVLAKSGAGKSYFVGCLLEEIMEKKVPLLLIDTHGEYISLKRKNSNESEIIRMNLFNIKPKSYYSNILEYGNMEFNSGCKPLQFYDELSPQEIMMMLPSKLTGAQESILYGVLKNIDKVNLDELIFLLEKEESPAKNQIINMVQMIKRLNLFSSVGIDFNELIQSGRCSIINMRGIAPEVQQLIVAKLLSDLFELRKKNKIPPFFAVIEEAHNFCPERSFGQAKCSNIIRNIASEGRKFGLGLGIISQRPARVDKSVLSQVTTQAILKITNPNDLKAIMNSVEGVSSETEEEIKSLPIGSGMITGVVDMPLFVEIRPRKTHHGGTSIDILTDTQQEEEFFEKLDDYEKEEKLPIIFPSISIKDFSLMQENSSDKIFIDLIPCVLCRCKEKNKDYQILIERLNGEVVKNIDFFETGSIPDLQNLNKIELKVLEKSFYKKKFSYQDFIGKHGGNLEVKNHLESLVSKNYLLKDNEHYFLNPKIILSNLSNFGLFSKIEFKQISYRKKENALLSIDKIKKNLNNFVEVLDIKDCYLVKYSV